MSSLLYISIAYYMQEGGEGVEIACKNAYVIIGRPLGVYLWQLTQCPIYSAASMG